jgi:hypothetical protein
MYNYVEKSTNYLKVGYKTVFHSVRPDFSGRLSSLTGACCSEVVLLLKLLGRDLEWSLFTLEKLSNVGTSSVLDHQDFLNG